MVVLGTITEIGLANVEVNPAGFELQEIVGGVWAVPVRLTLSIAQ